MCLFMYVHACLVSSPSTIFKQNFAYIKTTMDCILSDMNISWDMRATRVGMQVERLANTEQKICIY